MQIQKQVAAFLALWAILILGTSVVYGSQISVPSAPAANYFLISTTTGQYIATSTLQARFLAGLVTNAQLANPSIVVTTASPLGGAGTINLGGTLALTCTGCLTSLSGAASSTLLGDNNTFSGNIKFSTIKNSLLWLDANSQLSSTSTPTAAVFNATSTTASSTFNGVTATNINLTGTNATSTAANGIDITNGCFSISGSCLQQIISSASAYKQATTYASTTTLPTNTYNNGTGGVGATLTGVSNGPFYVDGNTPIVGARILVKNEATGANNGIYTLTQLGVAGLTPFILTRATDYNSSLDVFPGVANFVNSGTVNANTCWILTNTTAVTIGTTALTYADECGAGSFSGTYPIMVTGTTISTAFGTTTNNTFVTGQTFAGASSTDFTASHSFYGSFANGLAALDVNKLMYSVATSSETCTSPLSCGAHQVLAGGGAITIQNASASQGGAITSTDYQRLYAATTTALFPVTYNPTTNTFTSAFSTTTDTGLSRNGVMYTSNTGTFATAATGTVSAGSTQLTVTANRFVIGGALSIDCATAATAQSGCISSTDWNTFNLKNQNIGATTTNPMMATFYIATSSLIASRFPYASTTAISTTASSTFGGLQVTSGGLQVSTLVSASCDLKSDTSGNFFCGTDATGGGGSSSQWATTTTNTAAITPAGATYVTIGTSTPWFGALTVGSSTAPELMFTDNIAADPLWAINIWSGRFFLATSTALATSSISAFSISNTTGAITSNAGATSTFSSSLSMTSFNISATSSGSQGINISSGCFAIAGTCVTGAQGATGPTGPWPFTPSNLYGQVASASSTLLYLTGAPYSLIASSTYISNYLRVGTSTDGLFQALFASSTAPQIALNDNNTVDNLWVFRAINNNLYIATSTGAATSTTAAFSINPNGYGNFPIGVAVGSTTPSAALSIQSMSPYLVMVSTSTTAISPVFAINQYGGIQSCITYAPTSTIMQLDWSATCPQVEYRDVGTAAFSLNIINATTSSGALIRNKIVWICNGVSTAGALTWGGVEWIGGTTPTQTTTANTCDIYSFDITHATSTTAYKVAGTQGAGFK